MYDVHVRLAARPGELARFGKVMGEAGVSLEGGGVFTVPDGGHAHFLVEDGELARVAAGEAGLDVVAVREVLVRRLDDESQANSAQWPRRWQVPVSTSRRCTVTMPIS
jgi:hypothetical protein